MNKDIRNRLLKVAKLLEKTSIGQQILDTVTIWNKVDELDKCILNAISLATKIGELKNTELSEQVERRISNILYKFSSELESSVYNPNVSGTASVKKLLEQEYNRSKNPDLD